MILASIPFANSAPFFHGLDPAWLKNQRVISDAPRDLGRLARGGGADAGLFSLVDLWELETAGGFEPLAPLGIAGKGKIQSILLFGAEDPRKLEGRRIAVSGQTSTSVRLMGLWLKEKIGVKSWTPVSLGQEADAALLIGDQALARKLSAREGDPPPIDLCEQWTAWTGLPFVFARWGVRSALPGGERRALLEQVEKALASYEAGPAALAAALAATTGFPPEFLAQYLGGIRYRLGGEELAGAAEFRNRLGGME